MLHLGPQLPCSLGCPKWRRGLPRFYPSLFLRIKAAVAGVLVGVRDLLPTPVDSEEAPLPRSHFPAMGETKHSLNRSPKLATMTCGNERGVC